MGLPPRGLPFAPIGVPLGTPALVAFALVDRLAPMGACGRGRLQGLVPGASPFRRGPEGARRPVPPRGFTLQSVLPLRAAPRLAIRGGSPHALRAVRRRTVLRPGGFRCGGIGWPLSGLPALLGFSRLATVAASFRSARGAGSWLRLAARTVASGPDNSLPPRNRPGRDSRPVPGAAVRRRTAVNLCQSRRPVCQRSMRGSKPCKRRTPASPLRTVLNVTGRHAPASICIVPIICHSVDCILGGPPLGAGPRRPGGGASHRTASCSAPGWAPFRTKSRGDRPRRRLAGALDLRALSLPAREEPPMSPDRRKRRGAKRALASKTAAPAKPAPRRKIAGGRRPTTPDPGRLTWRPQWAGIKRRKAGPAPTRGGRV